MRRTVENLTGATAESPVARLPEPFDWRRQDALYDQDQRGNRIGEHNDGPGLTPP